MRTTLRDGISPVLREDYPRVLGVWEASVRATNDFMTEADLQFYIPRVRDSLPHARTLACVRDSQQVVVAFVAVTGEKINMLFVHPAWRGVGVGKRLLRYAVDDLGATTLYVNEQNEQAVGFYKKLGFKVVARSETDSSGKPYPVLRMVLP